MGEPDYEYRYRQAIDIVQRAEKEILRLRMELVVEKAKRAAITSLAEEALDALQYLSAHNQA